MLDDLMMLAERFVAAQERMADSYEALARGCAVSDAYRETPDEAEEKVEEPDREELKKLLDEMGVDYPKRTWTSTLRELLDEAVKKSNIDAAHGPSMSEVIEDINEKGSQEVEANNGDLFEDFGTKELTIDDVRKALHFYSVRKTKEDAKKLMETVGLAQRLSDISEDKYVEIIEACKEG